MNSKQFGAILFAAIMVTSMAAGFLAFASVEPASADEEEALEPGDVTRPGLIEQPGVYTLQNDIDLGGEAIAAFEIKSDDVVLDGNGYTVSNGTSETIHILGQPSISNVTVKNLEVTGVETAIAAMNLQDGAFLDNRLVSNADAGLVIAGDASRNNDVTDSTFAGNEKGIFLRQGTAGTTMANNVFDSNHEVGIKASGSSGNAILDSTFTDHDGEKTIHVTGRSPDNVIRGNDITYSNGPEYAVHIGGESVGTVVEDNVIAHNGLGGISMGPPDGIIRNNEIYDNGDPGILLESGSATVEGNLVYENRIGVEVLSSSNDLSDNVVKNNLQWDVIAAEGATDNAVTGLDIDDAGTTVDVLPSAIDFALGGADAPTPDAPAEYTAIGKYVEATTTSAAGFIDVRMHYDDGDVTGVTESDLTVARYTDGAWTGIADAGVYQTGKYVFARTSESGILGAVAGTADIVNPVAEAGDDQTVLANTTVTFDPSDSWDDEGIVQYTWDFGDGTTETTETDTAVTHVYDTGGTYTVTLTVSDAAGNTDTDTLTVTVLADDTEPPVADAGPDREVLVDTAVEFDGSNSTDNIGIESYEWEFGDGTTATGLAPTHTFMEAGTYLVNLTVTDYAGNTDTDTAEVLVILTDDEAPVADAGGDRTVEVGSSVVFDGSDSTDNIGIVSYDWGFGDGTTASGEVVSHTYTAEGTYTLSLTVADEAGNTDTDQATITVAEHVDEEVLTPGDIDTCGVIEEEGVYTLTKDLYASEHGLATCFEIKASNVTLDGNGYSVVGDIPDAAEGIHVLGTGSETALENVTVTDLTLTQWDGGIAAKNVVDSTFENNVFVSNVDKGMALSGSSSTNNDVIGNVFEDNQKGIFVERGVTHTTIENNEFISNHEVGVKVSGAPDTDLLGNYFTGHDGEKTVHFTGESRRATIIGNEIEYSSGPEYAIHIGGESGDSVVAHNVVANNTLGGISAGPLNVELRNNTVRDNGDIGILVGDGGANVWENSVYRNAVGIQFDASTGVTATDNVVKNNRVTDLMAVDGATNNDVTGLVVDDAGTTLAIGPASLDFEIEGGVAAPAPLPGDYVAGGENIDVEYTSEAGRLADLEMGYDSAISGTDEDNLALLRYDADMSWWIGVASSIDTGADTLTASLDEPGVVVPAYGTSDIVPPTANASAEPTIVATNGTVTFDGSASTDNEGVVSYDWNFSDGSTDSGEVVEHAFAEGGSYLVTLTVHDAAGYYDVDTVEISVDGELPVAEAGPDVRVQPNVSVTFDGSASTDDIGIASYEWNFGDGTNATGEIVSHTYTAEDTYTVTLTVTDSVGNTATDSLTVEVSEYVSVPEAIDANDDGQIGDLEILTAIEYWRNDAEVPNTGGQTIDDLTILDLIESWRTGGEM